MDLLDDTASHNASQTSSKVRKNCEDLERFKTLADNLPFSDIITTAYLAKDTISADDPETSEFWSLEFSAESFVNLPSLQSSLYSSSSSDTSDLAPSEAGLTAANAAFLGVREEPPCRRFIITNRAGK